MSDKVKIAWWGKHFGEEPPLIGNKDQGAGGIFFSGCNLCCVFCQNKQISQGNFGRDYSIDELVEVMLGLQKQGAINIDLVTPTIWWRQIKQAVILAKNKGLKIPIVWNSNGYELVDVLRELKGSVDIYLPDFKYSNNELAWKYSGIKRYLEVAKKAIEEMYSQVGLFKEVNGVGKRGLIVRHLVLPGAVENSYQVLKELASMDTRIHIALMNQYTPLYGAKDIPELNRAVDSEEFNLVYDYLLKLGFINGWVQDEGSRGVLVPDFKKDNPF
jgi:putative pyruvate formate lyase activating enzyme